MNNQLIMSRNLIFILALLIWSCNWQENPNKKKIEEVSDIQNEPNFSELKEDDCVFDFVSQTDEFMKDLSQFGNYEWDNQSKVATALLKNGDTLKITRGGCDHYSSYIELLGKTSDSLSLDNTEKCIAKAKQLSKVIFEEYHYQLIDSLLAHKEYELQSNEQQYYIQFNQDLYCDMTLVIEEDQSGNFSILIGYYLC